MKDYSVLNGMIENQKSELRTAYDKGYDQGYVEGQKHDLEHTENIVRSHEKCKSVLEAEYERGLNDAWMCAKKIISKNGEGYNATDLEVFGVDDGFELSALEAVERLKEYEKKHYNLPVSMRGEINIGDEVKITEEDGIFRAIVIQRDNTKYPYTIMYDNGDTQYVEEGSLEKTGRHFDAFENLLKQMREGECE